MGAAAVGASLGADVGRGRRDAEAVLRECVFDPELERERIAGLLVEHVLHDDTIPVVVGRPPGSVAYEPVDGVSSLGLGELQLMTTPVELVHAVSNAIRPRNQHLPPPGCRRLVDRVAVEHVLVSHRVRAKAAADLDDDRLLPVPSAISNCSPEGWPMATPAVGGGTQGSAFGRRRRRTTEPIAAAMTAAKA